MNHRRCNCWCIWLIVFDTNVGLFSKNSKFFLFLKSNFNPGCNEEISAKIIFYIHASFQGARSIGDIFRSGGPSVVGGIVYMYGVAGYKKGIHQDSFELYRRHAAQRSGPQDNPQGMDRRENGLECFVK